MTRANPYVKTLGQPTRKIGKSHMTLTGKLHLPGTDRRIAFESALERDFFILQWFDPLMTDMLEQPIKIPYEMVNGKNSFYTPDALVSYRGKTTILVEIKNSAILLKEKLNLEPKFCAARQLAEARGWVFQVFTEKEIRTARFRLAWHMLPFARGNCKDEELGIIVEALRSLGRRASFGEVLQLAEERGMVRQVAMRVVQQAMARRLISYEEMFPIMMDTILLLRGREGIHLVGAEG